GVLRAGGSGGAPRRTGAGSRSPPTGRRARVRRYGGAFAESALRCASLGSRVRGGDGCGGSEFPSTARSADALSSVLDAAATVGPHTGEVVAIGTGQATHRAAARSSHRGSRREERDRAEGRDDGEQHGQNSLHGSPRFRRGARHTPVRPRVEEA